MRAKQTSLLHEQQKEDEHIGNVPDWTPPVISNRPMSEAELKEKVWNAESVIYTKCVFCFKLPPRKVKIMKLSLFASTTVIIR